MGGSSRCNGALEIKHREWRPVYDDYFNLKKAAGVCRSLDCGSAVSTTRKENTAPDGPIWMINFLCDWTGSTLKECVMEDVGHWPGLIEITCSGKSI